MNTATGQFSGTPSQTGTFNFTVRVVDAANVGVNKAFTIVITLSQPLTITTASPLPSGSAGIAYAHSFQATGGVSPYQWSIVLGSPPPGLLLNTATGQLSGTPSQSGTFNFTVRVVDAANVEFNKTFTLVITQPLTITTASPLPPGMPGVFYSHTLQATGGVTPYRWGIIGGALPAGLNLDVASGTISGTTAVSGTFNFTISVIDSANATANKPFVLEITQTPTISRVVNGASLEVRLSPGVHAIAYGVSLGPQEAVNGLAPGLTVFVNGRAAPVFYSAATQITFQVPFEVDLGAANLVIEYQDRRSTAFPLQLTAYAPGIFPLFANAQSPFLRSNEAPATAQDPGRAGERLTMFLAGLGQTNPAALTGVLPSGPAPGPATLTHPSVTIAGHTVALHSSTLSFARSASMR